MVLAGGEIKKSGLLQNLKKILSPVMRVNHSVKKLFGQEFFTSVFL
jgi:hypothetical protein